MASKSAIGQSIVRLRERDAANVTRYLDMQLSLSCLDTGERLITVGGVWDKADKRYIGPAATEHVIVIQPAQIVAARWLCEWLRRFAHDRNLRAQGHDPATAWLDFKRVWSVLFHGGRRGGKSHLACVALVVFSVMVPGTVCWAVSPTEEKTEELRIAIVKLLPDAWYSYVKDNLTFTLGNWSQIVQRSGHKYENLKAGGVGLSLYNEGQQMDERGFLQLRGANDSGALTIVTANPPDKPIGRWVERFVDDVRAAQREARTFFFDWRKNPFIEKASLEAMARETDEKTYRREILGEFVPIGDVVFHAWSDRANIRPAPAGQADGFRDITREVTRSHLGRAFDFVVGADFDKVPHLAAAVFKIFERTCPSDADGDGGGLGSHLGADIPVGVPLYWAIGEAIVELSDEDGLIDALENLDLDPASTAVICDASGLTSQDTHRTGRTSGEWFRARGWRYLFFPDPDRQKNPNVVERCKLGNALLRSHSGSRRLFSVPANEHINRAMKLWEIKHLAPFRRSRWAHACDAVTYPLWRFEGRRRIKSKAAYKSVKRFRRRNMLKGY